MYPYPSHWLFVHTAFGVYPSNFPSSLCRILLKETLVVLLVRLRISRGFCAARLLFDAREEQQFMQMRLGRCRKLFYWFDFLNTSYNERSRCFPLRRSWTGHCTSGTRPGTLLYYVFWVGKEVKFFFL